MICNIKRIFSIFISFTNNLYVHPQANFKSTFRIWMGISKKRPFRANFFSAHGMIIFIISYYSLRPFFQFCKLIFCCFKPWKTNETYYLVQWNYMEAKSYLSCINSFFSFLKENIPVQVIPCTIKKYLLYLIDRQIIFEWTPCCSHNSTQ